MTLKHIRIAYLLVCAAISALVVPEAVCYTGGAGLWSGSSCSFGEELTYRVLFVGLSWLCVLIATLIWREDW